MSGAIYSYRTEKCVALYIMDLKMCGAIYRTEKCSVAELELVEPKLFEIWSRSQIILLINLAVCLNEDKLITTSIGMVLLLQYTLEQF